MPYWPFEGLTEMPWTKDNFPPALKNLTPTQRQKAIAIANAILRDCRARGGDGCEGKAIRIAIARVKGGEFMEKYGFPVELPIALQESIKTAEESWVEILREGEYKHDVYGKVKIDRTRLERIKANFENKVRGIDIALDVAHDPDRGAAGWIVELDVRPSTADPNKMSLWGRVKWTPWGKELVGGGVYKYISAEFGPWVDPETGEKHEDVLYAATLTNRPFIKQMAPVALDEIKGFLLRAYEGLKALFERKEDEVTTLAEGGVVPKNPPNYPKADPATPWEKPRLEDFTSKDWDELSVAEKRAIASCFAWAPQMPPERFTDLKLPHHRPSDKAVVWNGVRAAMAALMGARGGVQIPASAKRRVYAHLAGHYQDFGKEPPPFKGEENEMEVNMIEKLKEYLAGLGIELAEDTDLFEALKAHIDGLTGKIAELEAKVAELETVKAEENVEETTKLAEENKKLAERVAELEKKLFEQERQVFFDEMVRKGKLTPAERPHFEALYEKDKETVVKLLSEREPVVDMEEHGVSTTEKPNPEDELIEKAQKLAEEKGLSFRDAFLEVALSREE